MRSIRMFSPAVLAFLVAVIVTTCLTPVAYALALVQTEAPHNSTAHLIATFWPVIAVAVPTVVSLAWQAAKKTVAQRLDRLSPAVQGFLVAVLSAGIGTFAAHFGADITGVPVLSPEAITIIILQALAPAKVYDVAFRSPVQPALARR